MDMGGDAHVLLKHASLSDFKASHLLVIVYFELFESGSLLGLIQRVKYARFLQDSGDISVDFEFRVLDENIEALLSHLLLLLLGETLLGVPELDGLLKNYLFLSLKVLHLFNGLEHSGLGIILDLILLLLEELELTLFLRIQVVLELSSKLGDVDGHDGLGLLQQVADVLVLVQSILVIDLLHFLFDHIGVVLVHWVLLLELFELSESIRQMLFVRLVEDLSGASHLSLNSFPGRSFLMSDFVVGLFSGLLSDLLDMLLSSLLSSLLQGHLLVRLVLLGEAPSLLAVEGGVDVIVFGALGGDGGSLN
mmetsp:Transcript_8497/g.13025  ORF Transcript_8497/g.13025 Transcript_8497/m.13025 type:complete len:307 (+) Transcript_8497:7439-8359(+)